MTTIFASVELGSPAADCNHFGICSINVLPPEQWELLRPKHLRHIKAVLSAGQAGGLLFQIPPDGIRLDTFEQFFPPDGFRVDSAKMLPAALTVPLGLCQGAHTKPGSYAWQMGEGFLRMELAIMAVALEIPVAA